jgi:hypothetical protein
LDPPSFYLVQTEEQGVDGGDGVEHDAVDAAGEKVSQGSQAAGLENVLTGDALILDAAVVTWDCW